MTPSEERESEMADLYDEWFAEIAHSGDGHSRAVTSQSIPHNDQLSRELSPGRYQDEVFENEDRSRQHGATTPEINQTTHGTLPRPGGYVWRKHSRRALHDMASSNPEIFIIIANACGNWRPSKLQLEHIDAVVLRFIDSKLEHLNEPVPGMGARTAGLGTGSYALTREFIVGITSYERRTLALKIVKAVKASGESGSIQVELAKVGLISRHRIR